MVWKFRHLRDAATAASYNLSATTATKRAVVINMQADVDNVTKEI